MSPSAIFVLFWRINVQLVYPYGYMDRSLEDALNDDNLVWSKGDRIERNLEWLLRDSFRTSVILVLMMEMLRFVDLAVNIPNAVLNRL
ncbi:uncharacterized protein LOC108099298 isoform X1 [Drosophila ficusphila]|uniref:uncharacterized protein LOC108099298 isoform X1 n=1 Tax=Drosophila ficusphila TaxID=30025 RepID=UPI0007E78462|nr:uncharacterized protein LOC108099298 isoform X1 [Drosophila ficusphila]